MIEEYREWGVRSRRTDGPGELTIPAQSKEDAEHTVELVRPSDTKIVEVVSRAIGPMETEEEREARQRLEEGDKLVYFAEVLMTTYLPKDNIQAVQSLGAFSRLSSALDVFEKRHIFRPDVKLVATLQRPRNGQVYYLVHPSVIAKDDLAGYFERMGMVARIWLEALQP